MAKIAASRREFNLTGGGMGAKESAATAQYLATDEGARNARARTGVEVQSLIDSQRSEFAQAGIGVGSAEKDQASVLGFVPAEKFGALEPG